LSASLVGGSAARARETLMDTVSMDDMPSFTRGTISRPLSPPATPQPAAGRRDFAASGCSSGLWSQQGESYTEQWPTAVGSPGQDLHRYNEGPARYIHGPPPVGSKATLDRVVQTSPRGRFLQGVGTGPAMPHPKTRLSCKRSTAGPDPYNVILSGNRWTQRSTMRFTPDNGSHRAPHILGRTAALAFDPYHVGHRNDWRHTSNSIRSMMAHPMPQTPGGSALLPRQLRTPTSNYPSYQRMRGFGDSNELLPMPKTRFGEGRSPFA